jgi:uncharacterized protein YbjT (DUF2867 family)
VAVGDLLDPGSVRSALNGVDTPFTVLRPGYFFQNDAQLKPVLTGAGLYPVPIGKAGIAAIDVRDIADAAVVSLTTDGHAGNNLVAPDPLSGPGAAAIWSEVLNKQVRYADLPVEAFEEQLRQIFPAWLAKDLRLMFEGYQDRGFAPEQRRCCYADLADRPYPRRYEDFVRETAAEWSK